MGILSLQIPQTGQPNSTEQPKVASNFTALQTLLNGNLDSSNLALNATNLTMVLSASNITAANNERVIGNGGVTITVPGPTANAVIAVGANAGASGASPVTISGGPFYGIGVADLSTSFVLGTAGCSVLLHAENTTRWRIIGEIDSGWVPLSLASGCVADHGTYTPSCRLRGDEVEFSGNILNSSGGAVTSVATLPSSTFWPAAVVAPATPFYQISVLTSGAVIVPNGFPNGDNLALDGVSYRAS